MVRYPIIFSNFILVYFKTLIIFFLGLFTFIYAPSPRFLYAQEEDFSSLSSFAGLPEFPAQTSEETQIVVSEFRVTGNTVIATEIIQQVLQPYQQRSYTLTSLQEVANILTSYYSEQGYLLARVILPPQEVLNGVVQLQVMEGLLQDITITGTERYRESWIRRAFTKVTSEKDTVIHQQSFEKIMLLLNDLPAVKITSEFHPGKNRGTADLAVTVSEQRPWNASVEVNTLGSEVVSQERTILSADRANFTGLGDILSLRVVKSLLNNSLLFGRLGYTIPIHESGTRFSAYFSNGDFEIEPNFSTLGVLGGTLSSAGFSFSQPLIRSRTRNLYLELGLDSKDTKPEGLSGLVNSDDRIRSLKIGTSCAISGIERYSSYLFTINQGLGDNLGGLKNNDPRSSRAASGADNNFTYFTMNASVTQKLSPRITVIGRGSGQFSTRSLVSGEQFFIGGSGSVRGYPPSEFVGDNGLNLGLEGRMSLLRDPRQDWAQLSLFLDYGMTQIKEPATGQKSSANILGTGLGFQGVLPYKLEYRLEAGFPLGSPEPTSGDKVTYYLQIVKRF